MSIKKILFSKDGEKLHVRDISKDFHSKHGFIKSSDLEKGGSVKSSLGKEFSVMEPSFIDHYNRIKRAPQIIPLKDIAQIIAETGIDKKSKILDSGTGSGALSVFLAHIAKEVISDELREDFAKVAEQNRVELELKNLKIVVKNIYDGISEKNLDLITLDLPEPWKVIPHAASALKVGGFLVSYSPSIPQTIDFVNAILKSENFLHLKTTEIIEREWEIEERRVRPKTSGVMHSGFLSFVRRIN